MTVELLLVCEWHNGLLINEPIQRPTWEQVEAAIHTLDEQTRNDLYLQPLASDPETYLAVGGGGGRYLVSGSIGNERFPTVVNRLEDDSGRELLVVGGQAGDYPANWIVDLETALRASRSFFDTGEFGGGGVLWQEV